jgi:osmotically-inducible protein OsmY
MNLHNRLTSRLIKLIASLTLASLMTSCVGVMVVGAAGSMIVYDRRSMTMIERDARIFYVISRAISNHRGFRHSHVTVTSYNQIVLLAGEVTSAELKKDAEKIAQSTPNVRRVYNELTVAESLPVTQRSKDTLLTGTIRTKMIAEKGLESGSIHIIVENGNVYLMGVVTREQADLAVNVARHVDGVIKVVKIFQYII